MSDERTFIYRGHAVKRMAERRVSRAEVEGVVTEGEVIKDYPDDTPYPSRLILGWSGERPLHVVAADNDEDNETIIITVYEPDPTIWTDDFRRKRE